MKWNTGFPQKSGEYVCITIYGTVQTYNYSNINKMFNADDFLDYEEAMRVQVNDSIICWVSIDEFFTEQGFRVIERDEIIKMLEAK